MASQLDKMNTFTKHLTPGCKNYLLWVHHLWLTTSLGHEMLNKEECKCAFLTLLSYEHTVSTILFYGNFSPRKFCPNVIFLHFTVCHSTQPS